jgi:hypothetical protein
LRRAALLASGVSVSVTAKAYRLLRAVHGEMRTSPEVYSSRAEAERVLWKMTGDGRADTTVDRRFRALVLLATFANPHYQLGNLYCPGQPHSLTCGTGCPRLTVRDRSSPGLMAR